MSFAGEDGEAAFGEEGAFVETVGDVAVGEGRMGVHGFGELGIPAFGELELDGAGFGAGETEEDGSAGRVFFVDDGKVDGSKDGGDAEAVDGEDDEAGSFG